jgi:hypothetical protein
LFRTSQFQETGERFPLLAVEFQRVHTCRAQAIFGSSQKPGLNERLNGFGDLLYVVSHKNREMLAGQECARMPMQKAQQIEFTGSAYERSAREHEPGVVLFFTDCRRLVSHHACNRRSRIGRTTQSYCDSPNETVQDCTHLPCTLRSRA